MRVFVAAATAAAAHLAAGAVDIKSVKQVSTANVVPGSYIVALATGSHLKRGFSSPHSELYSELKVRGANWEVTTEYDDPLLTGAAIKLDSDADLVKLAQASGVQSITPVRLYPAPKPASQYVVKTYNATAAKDTFSTHVMTGVDKLHADGYYGKGIKIGIIDSGVDYTHPALGGKFGPGNKIIGGWDFVGDAYTGNASTPPPKPDKDPREPLEPGPVPETTDLPVWSEAWYNKILCEKLRYQSLRPWQLSMTKAACEGKDVVCIIPTGGGKSALTQGPIAAFQAAGVPAVTIAVVPTKGLADDQARAATEKDLKALALHGDANRAAQAAKPPRNLFTEVMNGEWPLVFVGPEMLTSKKFTKILDPSASDFVTNRLKTVVVDECHLSDEWKDFRSTYLDIKRLRDRMPSKVAWIALSGTVAPSEFVAITSGLGFEEGRFKLVRDRIDRPDIKYVTRFIRHSVSGHEMFNFSWIVPVELTSTSEVDIMVIFVNHINFGIRLRAYLTSLLPTKITGSARTNFIRGFHSLHSEEYRKETIEALREGTETRVLLCTNTGAYGIDISEVRRVVIAQLSQTFKTQAQRAGRLRGEGEVIVYSMQQNC
ncbi:hypothetical protein FRC12_022501 [Ceratobasidium sp. 428]|nr:hypothetical protein FRC12_022501 [Ceratobasidium sp. 428]